MLNVLRNLSISEIFHLTMIIPRRLEGGSENDELNDSIQHISHGLLKLPKGKGLQAHRPTMPCTRLVLLILEIWCGILTLVQRIIWPQTLQTSTLQSDYEGPEQVTIGDGSGLAITHTGASSFISDNRTFHFKNILHVPNNSQNLISVSQFTKILSLNLTPPFALWRIATPKQRCLRVQFGMVSMVSSIKAHLVEFPSLY